MGIWRIAVAILLIAFTNDFLFAAKSDEDKVMQIPDWLEKTTSGIYFHIEEENFLEAWRIAQLAKTTNTPVDNLKYLIALTSTKLQICPLAFQTDEPWRNELLYAYAYRFRQQFASESTARSPYEFVDQKGFASQLDQNQKLYLEDIPLAIPLKKSGCKFYKSEFRDRKISASKEFAHLMLWKEHFEATSTKDNITGKPLVMFRILQLAKNQDLKEKTKTILEYFNTIQEKDWINLEEPERSVIWQDLVAIDKNKTIPLPQGHVQEKMIVEFMMQSKNKNISNWLGAIDFNSLSSDKQLQIIDHLLSIEDIKYKNWLLNQKMILIYRQGKIDETLTLIRQLTVVGESNGEEIIEKNSVIIASQLFAEYQYDSKLLGTIQSSIPAQFWTSVYRMMLLHHGLAGNRKGYQALMNNLESTKNLKRIRIKEKQLQLLESLVNRNEKQFNIILSQIEKTKSDIKETLRILDDIATEIFKLTRYQRATIHPFLISMGKFSLKHIKKENNLEKLELLLSLFDENFKIDWNEGSMTSRLGTQIIGTVNLSSDGLIESKFLWNEQFDLPLRDLIAYPSRQGKNSWIIK